MKDMFDFTDAQKIADDPRLGKTARDNRCSDSNSKYGKVAAVWRWPNGDEQIMVIGRGFSVTSDPQHFDIHN